MRRRSIPFQIVLPGDAFGYDDTTVSRGKFYEYRVVHVKQFNP